MERRKFIQQSVLAGGSMLAGSRMAFADTLQKKVSPTLTILHTNDVHSRLDPFPMDGSKMQGLGGVATRAQVIEQIRKQNEHVLLLDAGDIFQGTPYFNIYNGEPEIKAMSAMGYDACTMGNHDFDAGIENFATQMSRHASFPCINSNYDFTGTELEGKTIPYKTIKKGNLKIGIYGLGIKLKGLVAENLYKQTIYEDPLQKANEMTYLLKKKEKCDFIICLSHLGYSYKENDMISDEILAKESQYTDLIIGGHTHTFLDEPVVYKDRNGSDIFVNQVGWAGVKLGRLDFNFENVKKKNLLKSHSVNIAEKTNN